ncbi:MAG TPA: hypothetical protein VEI02_12585, partial [Planctomycetota bacterium]|nr:hypothetical protein [Planctomycetota bacterium]
KDPAVHASQAGLIFDGGFEGPVVLALGQLGAPNGVWFHGAEGPVEGLGFAPLSPTDPDCPYYLVWRPTGCGGAVESIKLQNFIVGNTFFMALPPIGDALIQSPTWPTFL